MTSKDAASSSLGGQAARGAGSTMLGQIIRIAIQLLSVVVLARFLDPKDYGIIAMVTAVIGIADVVRDFGLSSAAVQAASLSKAERDQLFWINTGLGALLAALCCLSAPLLAALYGDQAIVAVTIALSSTFLINGMASQYRASLMRSLQFGRVAAADVLAATVGLAAAVLYATLSPTYWAIVVQQTSVAVVGLLVVISFARWLPGRPRKTVPLRRFYRYGGNLSAAQLMVYLTSNLDSVLLGVIAGPTVLGQYNRAFQLFMLPLRQISAPATRVALPVLSRLQHDARRFDEFLLRGQAVVVHVVIFALMFAGAFADSLIPLVLGPGWEGVIPIFQVLTFAGIAQVAGYASYWVFLARGLTGSNLRFSLVTRPFFIAAIVVGSFYGAVGTAAGVTAGTALTWVAGLVWVSRAADAPGLQMFVNALRPFLVYGVSSYGASWVIQRYSFSSAPVGSAVIGLVAVLVLSWVAYLCWPGFRRDVRGLLQVASLMKSRGRLSGP
ncbi:lipopolysaccharide biosynthesis protein [Curtobacterium sp. BRD11]|uniref:lipopolysaccharide biosynthesis protein n=1 Tax=Curtobacterium sp. BRD11 TaxID=2962581 RepID=UPI0028812765|nr:lipopolysaccharide biosynthesis protein [Curtobacterium sp. BRD11]MDT0211479.1 lipopolysaccharide biosynthesis protein [Curtobacterium sp. BRD11]